MALTDYIEQKPVIEAERVLLRPMTVDDVPDLRDWMPDPAIYAYWGKGPGKAERDPALLFERQEKPSKSFHLGIALKDGNRVIGNVWIYRIEKGRMATVALRLSRRYHGQGYGTESLSAMTRFCFEQTELQRLWTEVDVRNTASQRILEKCGYTREGLIRQGRMVNSWCDYYIYGILAEDVQPPRCS